MNDQKNSTLDQFSSHLFWDVDRATLNMDLHAGQIIERVMGYGLLNDWRIIYKYYGLKRIAEVCTRLRALDVVSLHFISRLSNTPLDEFSCYTSKQLTEKHWVS